MINIKNVNYKTITMLIATINVCNDLGIVLSILYLDGTNPCSQQNIFNFHKNRKNIPELL